MTTSSLEVGAPAGDHVSPAHVVAPVMVAVLTTALAAKTVNTDNSNSAILIVKIFMVKKIIL
jgi:hypothetical protein